MAAAAGDAFAWPTSIITDPTTVAAAAAAVECVLQAVIYLSQQDQSSSAHQPDQLVPAADGTCSRSKQQPQLVQLFFCMCVCVCVSQRTDVSNQLTDSPSQGTDYLRSGEG